MDDVARGPDRPLTRRERRALEAERLGGPEDGSDAAPIDAPWEPANAQWDQPSGDRADQELVADEPDDVPQAPVAGSTLGGTTWSDDVRWSLHGELPRELPAEPEVDDVRWDIGREGGADSAEPDVPDAGGTVEDAVPGVDREVSGSGPDGTIEPVSDGLGDDVSEPPHAAPAAVAADARVGLADGRRRGRPAAAAGCRSARPGPERCLPTTSPMRLPTNRPIRLSTSSQASRRTRARAASTESSVMWGLLSCPTCPTYA